ncbi:hypothetical protein QQZ08_001398 [Neonectria magnoliae]|uniref:RelA/SpoT domain-containing protein n=1 Tax=Neonectria magnoliae TaxID=2732573 RepID=A0ABR1IGX3_9HYPO
MRKTKQHPEIATVQTPASGQSQEGDTEPVGDLISSTDTPYTNEFAGYRATHLRVELGSKDPSIDIQYTTTMIEIQVASLLMHAWSEVNHDLAYKTLNGTPSDGELRILDGINGLVCTGEVLLGSPSSLEPHLQRWNKESTKPIQYPVVLSILNFIFNVVHDQQTVDPLVAPYLKANLNEKFSAANRTEQLVYLLYILKYASTFDFNPKGLRDDAPSEFPQAHDTLKDKGLLKVFKRSGQSLVVEDKDADAFTKDVKELWSWFATNVALGMARVQLGSTI